MLAEDGENIRSRVKPIAFCIDGKAWVNNHAHVLRCTKIERRFLEYHLNKMDLSPYFIGATRPKITKTMMLGMPIIYPDFELQQKFATLVENIEAMKERQTKSREHIDETFQALMQKAFKGELIA